MFHFFRKYHYVPPCPKCGSYKTGRFYYVSTTFQKIERMIAENMRYGELSRIEVGFGDELEHNAYCEECGVQWRANIEELPLTDERILEEMKRRGITQTGIKNMRNNRKIVKKQKQLEKKQLKKQKKEEKQKMKKKNIKIQQLKSENVIEPQDKTLTPIEPIKDKKIEQNSKQKSVDATKKDEKPTNKEMIKQKSQVKPLVKPLPKKKK